MSNFEMLIKDFSVDKEGTWAYPSLVNQYELPEYGFKIHISATIKNAYYIFSCVKDILETNSLMYKIISSNKNLVLLNGGEFGYSQIGKFITIYPPDDKIFNTVLELLYRATLGFHSIEIPSDYKYKNSNIVFYRYGEMRAHQDITKDARMKMIPEGITVPVQDYYIQRYKILPTHYVPFFCIRTRGKTRIFQGIELNNKMPIIIKEGIMLGEVDEGGIDGANGVMNEKEILKALTDTDMFPRLIDFFYVGDSFYIIEEFIKGDTLLQLIIDSKFEFIYKHKMLVLRQIFSALMEMHKKNILIGDLSPDNIIINNEGKVKLIDVEYYCFRGKGLDFRRGTKGFWCYEFSGEKAVIYMLVSLWYYLFKPQDYKELCISLSKEKYYECNVDKYVMFNYHFKYLFSIEDYEEALNYLGMLIDTYINSGV